MKPDAILSAPILDILFENRNKAYGAYELRTHYNERMRIAMTAMFVGMSVLIAAIYYKNNNGNSGMRHAIPSTAFDSLVKVIIPPEPKPIVPPTPKPVAEVKNVTIRIVQIVDTPEVPKNDDLVNKNIGTQNVEGEDPGDKAQLPAGPSGSGNVAGDKPAEPAEPEIYESAQLMPEFPGGLAALQRYLSRNLKTPGDMEPGAKVRVMARFVVDQDGTITGIGIEQSGGTEFDNEVKRVVKKMPVWKPGRQNGRAVSVYFKIPVIFQGLDDN